MAGWREGKPSRNRGKSHHQGRRDRGEWDADDFPFHQKRRSTLWLVEHTGGLGKVPSVWEIRLRL